MRLLPIGVALFLLGLNKGGFPIGGVVLPLLVLVWPDPANAVREAVGFMLPVLCLMDILAMALYFRDVEWRRVRLPLLGAIPAVALTTLFALRDPGMAPVLPDAVLRITIGTLGLGFVALRLARGRFVSSTNPCAPTALGFGAVAGFSSTLAHAAAPIMQIYFLPQNLPKMRFAATMAAFFFLLNLVKVPFFLATHRIHADNLRLALSLLPLIPLGVVTGFLLVRRMRPDRYPRLIVMVLTAMSLLLILTAWNS